MTKNMCTRREKAAETKNKIIQCADELFREYSFEKVSVDSIVEKAGLSKGAFYVHFDSKDSLIAELITEYVRKSDSDYRSFIESFPEEIASSDMLIALAEKIADNITCKTGYSLMKIAYRIQIERTIDTGMLLNYSRDIYGLFCDLINRGMRKGEFKSGLPATVAADHLVMAIRGLTYEWCIRHPDFDYKAQLSKHFEIMLYGLTGGNRR